MGPYKRLNHFTVEARRSSTAASFHPKRGLLHPPMKSTSACPSSTYGLRRGSPSQPAITASKNRNVASSLGTGGAEGLALGVCGGSKTFRRSVRDVAPCTATCPRVVESSLPVAPPQAAGARPPSPGTPRPRTGYFSSRSRSSCIAASGSRVLPGTPGSSDSESGAISGPLVCDNSTRSTQCSRCSCSVLRWSREFSLPPRAWRCCGPA